MKKTLKNLFSFLPLIFLFLSNSFESLAFQTSLLATEPMVSDTSYLSNIVEELKKKWPKNRTINLVFHGHSVPSGYLTGGIITTFDAYPMLVLKHITDRYQTAMVNVIKTSIGGENAVQGAERFKTSVLNHKPDVIFIDYALNDRKNGLEKSKIAWEAMIKQAIEANVKVVLLTPTPDLTEDIKNENAVLAQHSIQIRALAKQYKIPVIDSYLCFKKIAETENSLKKYMSQNNHINGIGHGFVADLIKPLFKLNF